MRHLRVVSPWILVLSAAALVLVSGCSVDVPETTNERLAEQELGLLVDPGREMIVFDVECRPFDQGVAFVALVGGGDSITTLYRVTEPSGAFRLSGNDDGVDADGPSDVPAVGQNAIVATLDEGLGGGVMAVVTEADRQVFPETVERAPQCALALLADS